MSFAGDGAGARIIDLTAGLSGLAPRIMPLGDSNTRGWAPEPEASWEGYRLDLFQMLTASGYWIDYVGAYSHGPAGMQDTDHYGFTGVTALTVESSTASSAATTFLADVVLLMLGTNDALQRSDAPQTVPPALLSIMEQLDDAHPGVLILVAPLPPITAAAGGPFSPGLAQQINAQLPALVTQAQGMGINAQYVSVPAMDDSDVYDGLHLTPEAHAELAQAWFDALTATWALSGGSIAGPTQSTAGVVNAVGSAFGDLLRGDAAANGLDGGSGSDRIEGRAGADTLIGGAGLDMFAYGSISEGGDLIGDFVSGEDRIEISASGFGGGLAAGGSVTLVAGTAPSAAGGAGQFLYDTGSGNLFWDADGDGAAAALLLATLHGAPSLAQDDFLIV